MSGVRVDMPALPAPSLRRIAALGGCALVMAALMAGRAAAEEGPSWRNLSAQQRSALQPLERDWSRIDAGRKQKWLEIAARYPKMPPDEQKRISERMNSWANMTPTERGQARLNFQEARQVTPQDRQARWEAYQALSPEEKRQLATRAAPVPAKPADTPRRSNGQDKSNLVPNPAYAAPPKAIAPTVVQAQPGATTTLVNKRPAPPTHQQPGLPKIAATPGFVDKSTLLPRRGPQAAAIHSAAEPESRANPAR